MRKHVAARKKKKTRLCAFSVHNNYTRSRSLFPSISLSGPATLLFRSLSWNLFARIRGCWTDCVRRPYPLLSLLRPLNHSAQLLLLLCLLAFLQSSLFFVWSVTIITLVTFFLVYTSLYLVKFSKFTIKITYGFFLSVKWWQSRLVQQIHNTHSLISALLSLSLFFTLSPQLPVFHSLSFSLSFTLSHSLSLSHLPSAFFFFFNFLP